MSTKQKLGTAPAKRTGRPIKEARKGRRYQIGVIVTGQTKSLIAAKAKESGRTISREVEQMIERLLQYEGMFGMDADALPTLLRHRGYTRVAITHLRTGQRSFAWVEPGVLEESGFIADETEQPK